MEFEPGLAKAIFICGLLVRTVDLVLWGLAAILLFGMFCGMLLWLLGRSHRPVPFAFNDLWHYLADRGYKPNSASLVAMEDNLLLRRNEWWSTMAQFGITCFLLFSLAVLLILGIVSAEAGLPILAGLGGVAAGRVWNNTRGHEGRNEDSPLSSQESRPR